jgi:putative transcriptional regulator
MRNRIKEFRAKHNITQEKLAQIVGVRRETVIFLEQGKYNPSLRLAHNVAKALKTSVDELFIFEDLRLEEDIKCQEHGDQQQRVS